jgi:hypothetical protein
MVLRLPSVHKPSLRKRPYGRFRILLSLARTGQTGYGSTPRSAKPCVLLPCVCPLS